MHLANFDIAVFLRDYWQKKPLLIRHPWQSWRNPLDPDELAGLACEEGVEARLVVQADGAWSVEHGPLAEARFGALGAEPWTLLVQAVDHHVPAVAALLAPFRFVPDWRIDDVMVSYAVDGGGVGPHFDQYDVFLIQGLGRRRWRIGGVCDDATSLLPDDDLRLLADFVATDEWVLEPGDMLYLPPRVAHDGIAVGDDCMTYSIGFRAPARSELIAHWCDHLLAELSDDDRYEDRDLATQGNPGEISAAAIARLHTMVADRMLDRDAFAHWFGRYTSTPKEVDGAPGEAPATDALRHLIAGGVPLLRNPASRFSFIRQDAAIQLFVDGRSFECRGDAGGFSEQLCARDRVVIDPALVASQAAMALIAQLVAQGSVAFDDD